MMQRIQSVWLLGATLCSLLTLKFPFYTGNTANNLFAELNSKSHFLLLVLAVAIALTSFVTIFLFRNRKQQIRLGLLALGLTLVHLVFLFLQTDAYKTGEGGMHLWSVIYFANPLLLILAIRGVYRDEQLVRSMDRLR